MTGPELPDYAEHNRDHWMRANSTYTAARAQDAWRQDGITWGVWGTPESAYFGAWLKKRGAAASSESTSRRPSSTPRGE